MVGKWIWTKGQDGMDVYAEFRSEFSYNGGKIRLEISADSEYAVFINGKFVYSGQYADFPWYKVYDEIDIGGYVKTGANILTVWVWYSGDCNFCHYVNRAGVRFGVVEEGEVKACSSAQTQSRPLPYFTCGLVKRITGQMGLSFRMDGRAVPAAFENAVELDGMPEDTFLRPISLLEILPARAAEKVGEKVFDLGRETVGLPFVELTAPYGEEIVVSFGERLTEEGKVPRLIGERDFSFTIVGNGEKMRVFNPLRKLGLRYLEVEGNCIVHEMGVLPLQYPFKEVKRNFKDGRRQKIYDVAVRTLRLNAFEHYFDCPWREQAFYALDSRLQMRYGYKAFSSAEYQYGALRLMSEDRNPTGHISIVVPTSASLIIPSFSLFYVIAMEEYATTTGDTRLIEKYYAKLTDVMEKFLSNKSNETGGLVAAFQGKNFWNFYEWNDCLDGNLGGDTARYETDSALNLNVVLALQSLVKICKLLGKDSREYEETTERLQTKINEAFYDAEKGLYKIAATSAEYAELCNAYAVLTGTATGERAEKICEMLADKKSGLVECTLSMLPFKYDALIKQNKEKYAAYVLNDIDEKYGYMLSEGATSFWETLKGWRDFDNAGSLCHGWAALPVYYYTLLDT